MVRPPMRPAMGMVLWKVSWLAEDSSWVHCFFSSPFLNCWCEKIMMSETYMTQEKNKSPTRCQLTALKVPLQRPTPTVAPVMHMDVETGSLYCEKMRMVMAAPVSKEEFALVIVLAQMVWQGNCSVTYPSPWKSHAKVSGR